MAQPSNAQREPSMEEILASIRKIIEDTDGAHSGEPSEIIASASAERDDRLGAASLDDVGDPAIESHEPPLSESQDDVSAFRDVFQERGADLAPSDDDQFTAAPAAEPSASEPARPFTLSDVQRRVMSERETGSAGSEPGINNDRDAANAGATGPVPAVIVGEDDLASTADERKPESGGLADAQDFEAGDSSPGEHSAPSILSEHASRQVAGAFDELKDAFFTSRKRSFDDMAEEMMRPMLQEWLDNNSAASGGAFGTRGDRAYSSRRIAALFMLIC